VIDPVLRNLRRDRGSEAGKLLASHFDDRSPCF